jgi:hypothetical protein
MGFRHSAGFGKRIEFWIIGQMLKEGLDVYVPLVDDNAIDAVIRRPDRSFVEIQIKARSTDVEFGNAALFAAIPHELRSNYFFVFYSERLKTMWIMSSAEFLAESYHNKNGKNKGKRKIQFNGKRKTEEYVKPNFQKYICSNFNRLLTDDLTNEREDWAQMAVQSLARAYADNEPEYGLDSIKEFNPEYKQR